MLRTWLCILFIWLPVALAAQTPPSTTVPASETVQLPVEEPEQVTVTLPDSYQLAMALSTPETREQALLDLAAAAHVLSRTNGGQEVDHAALAQNYLDDRAWLQMLVDRHGWIRPHSPILDTAVWMVSEKLRQYNLEETELVLPGHIPESVLIYQVFQRSAPRLAMANLPVLLLEIEPRAITIWKEFLELSGPESLPDAAWKEVETTWFANRQMPPPPAAIINSANRVVRVEDIPLAMSKLVLSTVEVQPPDASSLVQLRFSILEKASEQAEAQNADALDQASDALHLVNIVDGLNDGLFFEFIQGLLSVTQSLLERPESTAEEFSFSQWLVKELPAVSAKYTADFAAVDPGLNTALAAAYEVLQGIASTSAEDSGDTAGDLQGLRSTLADAVAQLALLIPDMDYYFDTPVRARIVEEINICTSIAVRQDDSGNPAMTRSQFDACMDILLQLADRVSRLAELSGNMQGPFTTDTLRRELNVPPWQRVNYGIGYLQARFPGTCQVSGDALPNPLEWAVLANTMTWFAEYVPEFFHSPENETRLTKMRSIGEQLVLGLSEQAGCLAEGADVDDPVSRSMVDYEVALRELDAGIKNAELHFRTQRLRPGADVSLDQDALQRTAYRPEDIVIGPCDPAAVCEMSGSLTTTRALIGLFPDEYLIAEQTGMGQIEICYQNMEWVQRRSELVRADDENVANYFGRLAFDLLGRYVENGAVSEVFGFRFTSPQEHHYLFAQASEDVLNDNCPVEWVGTRVVTPLRQNRGGIVPDRLTYLAASRTLPSRLLQSNWGQGAEWRDWFVTGLGVTPLEVPTTTGIMTRLNQHLQSLYQAEQSDVYQRVLLPGVRDSQGDDVSLFDEMLQVSIAKAMIRMQIQLFYPESIRHSDTIRMAIAGDAGLLDGRVLRRFREEDIALTSVNTIALERLNSLRDSWLAQSQNVRRQGSMPPSLMHALTRINILYRQFFTMLPVPLQQVDGAAAPGE